MRSVLAATPGDLVAARTQMALSLGWHIIIACFGVAMPAFTAYAEWRGQRKGGDPVYTTLAHRWARSMGVLFAVGAVSGTILSFEMGLLWPRFMAMYGQVVGFPFTLEGTAFFIEAIFLGIYLYGWNRLPPRLHLLTAIPVVVAGVASAFFVVSANAWMNQPRGFDLDNGRVTNVNPWKAMFNPATPPQTTHMIIAAFMVAGFSAASVYAVAMLRGKRDRYHRLGFAIPFTVAAVLAPIQLLVGDWAAKFLATNQPVKLAAIEGLSRTTAGAPLSLGGVYVNGELKYAIHIPNALSILAHWNPSAVVYGLEIAPPDARPPVTAVHLAFQVMVGFGTAFILLAAWWAFLRWRRKDFSQTRWFLRAASVAGIGAVLALEAGWVTTELGRQPWIAWGRMRVIEAVNPEPGLTVGLVAVIVVYTVLTVASVAVLRRLARMPLELAVPGEAPAQRATPVEAPQEEPVRRRR
ncbi:cytochrome ubiquinol oxidase subunit I [Planosporangium flavigriseum]|uniref:Cytochrome ubiquinol oxidase subunit I n=1 Tax=Planosporangium flavigriseum TaxID=373681 RepID=A0A8J3LPM1_9ACTN|nr:cytochrome ubiquinol oxidase subunit I [Planosporangium flavigriseum]NJC65997.1 cytochrome ubiquinol oxidase subunit I [Planosporangium flavigriseum]GIG74540.1 cytochrome ubiquinol oxidase subunit I [Planosporangium flavigriseum]